MPAWPGRADGVRGASTRGVLSCLCSALLALPGTTDSAGLSPAFGYSTASFHNLLPGAQAWPSTGLVEHFVEGIDDRELKVLVVALDPEWHLRDALVQRSVDGLPGREGLHEVP